MITAVRTTLCVCCGAVLTSGGSLCRDDADQIMSEIRFAHDLLAELDVTLAREDRVIAAQHGKSAEVPLPFHVGASHATTELRTAIRAMGSGGITAGHVARFRTAKTRAMEVVDIPDPRTWVGVCTCGTALYARRGESEVQCAACGEPWTAAAVDAWPEVRRLVGSVSSIRQWLVMLGVTRSRAQLYRDVARLEPVDGGNLYSMADVLDRVAESKTQRRGA